MGFECLHCRQWVPTGGPMGTRHRNHCPFCLWSRHVDRQTSGDRGARCGGTMQPVGLTFKGEETDKYGRPRQGEIMIIHQCEECGRLSINRLAADDNLTEVQKVFDRSMAMEPEEHRLLAAEGITPLTEKDRSQVEVQLFGKRT